PSSVPKLPDRVGVEVHDHPLHPRGAAERCWARTRVGGWSLRVARLSSLGGIHRGAYPAQMRELPLHCIARWISGGLRSSNRRSARASSHLPRAGDSNSPVPSNCTTPACTGTG